MVLSYAQLEGAWVAGGGDPAKAPVAAAIAMAESAGNPLSHNGNAGTGDNSYGLWQINMLGSMGPERRARYNLPSNDALFDPVTNARVAVSMSDNGRNWGPWTTYTSGAYLRYLRGGVSPDSSGLSGGFGSAVGVDGSASSAVSLASFTDNTCVLGWSGLGGIFGSTGHFCLLTKSETRALVGGMILGTGVLVMGVGAVLLVLSFSSLPSAPKAVSGLLSPKTTPASGPAEPAAPSPVDTGKPKTTAAPPEKPAQLPAFKQNEKPSAPAGAASKLSMKMTAVKALKFVL